MKYQDNLWRANFEQFLHSKFCGLALLNKKFSERKVPKFAARNFFGILQQSLIINFDQLTKQVIIPTSLFTETFNRLSFSLERGSDSKGTENNDKALICA